jgi:DNA-binding MarR family transcriptional regulator
MAARKNLTEETGSLGALLRLPYQRLSHIVYGELARSGFADIRPAHSAVFRHISPDGSRATELAERAQMTKQSMGYLVDALTERGYVELAPDPTDGRAKLVCLTTRGESFVAAAMALSARVEEMAAREMGGEEMARLRDLLQQLDGAIAAQESALRPSAAWQRESG